MGGGSWRFDRTLASYSPGHATRGLGWRVSAGTRTSLGRRGAAGAGKGLEPDTTALLASIAQDVSSVRSYLAFFAGAFVVSVGITIVLWVIVSS